MKKNLIFSNKDAYVGTDGTNRFLTKALSLVESGEAAIIKTASDTYASEYVSDSGNPVVTVLTKNGTIKAAEVVSGRYRPIKEPADEADTTGIFLCLLAYCECLDDVPGQTQKAINDAIEQKVAAGQPALVFAGGYIDRLPETMVESGIFEGTLVTGRPKVLAGDKMESKNAASSSNFGAVHKKYEMYRNKWNWTEEEKALIPVFPEEAAVLPEVVKMAQLISSTEKDKRPMLNFIWRGITAYGKSTGVEQLAAILGMPLLKITCSPHMETQDFLTNLVPDTRPQMAFSEFPSFDEIELDPDGAYEKLTGEFRQGISPDDVMKAYFKKASSGTTSKFKLVESNYIKALERGYMLEVQEFSRIKESGVLAGLNEYDRPGARIPKVDGTFTTRHKNAVVVFSDNIGYVSCRPVDPSFVRRAARVFTSRQVPKESAIERILYNTGFSDKDLLEKMYGVWEELVLCCKDQDIDDGVISINELELWAQSVKADGYRNVVANAIDCVINKATSDEEAAEELTSVLLVHFDME